MHPWPGPHIDQALQVQHELHIGEQEFNLQESLAGHILQGDAFAIYYLDDSGILSLERLAAARPAWASPPNF